MGLFQEDCEGLERSIVIFDLAIAEIKALLIATAPNISEVVEVDSEASTTNVRFLLTGVFSLDFRCQTGKVSQVRILLTTSFCSILQGKCSLHNGQRVRRARSCIV